MKSTMDISLAEAQLVTSIASVVFSAVLVLVTYFYYLETKAHTDEMEKSREADFKPVLKATVEAYPTSNYRYAFENTGQGSAHDVSARWGFTHLDYEKEWKVPLMSTGQRHTFHLPFSDSSSVTSRVQIENELEDTDGTLYFEWECHDALGNRVSNREEIDVLETIQSRPGEIMVESEESRIHGELEDLNATISNIPSLLKANLDE